jgi:hypothetical protein
MEQTDGESCGGGGHPCPALLKLQGQQCAACGAGCGPLVGPVYAHVPPDLRLEFKWLFNDVLTTESSVSGSSPAVPDWKSVIIRAIGNMLHALMIFGVSYTVVTHASQHNPDGSHKTIQAEGTTRREDGGITKLETGDLKLDEDGNPQPECELRAKSCLYRRPDGRCEPTGQYCRIFGGSDGIREIQMGFSDLQMGLGKIEHHIEAVAHQQFELLKENEELRRLNKEGYFNFAVRVEGQDFLAFAVIMALGNRQAAAVHLGIPTRTLYSRVSQWAKRGRDYQLMCRYMEWRKRSARHLKVDLNPSLQTGESDGQPENPDTMGDVLTEIQAAAASESYPTLLADVLQALERQNTGNWQGVRAELVSIIKAELSQ